MIILDEEVMAPHFTKFHLRGLPFGAVLHKFSSIDSGDPHDHPWGFTSFILHGGYTEIVHNLETGSNELRTHNAGDAIKNTASHVHRIIKLHDTECWTMILPGPTERKSGFYKFTEKGFYHRFWDEPEYERFTSYAF